MKKQNPFIDLMILKRIVLSSKRTYENLLKEHSEKQLRCIKLFDKHKVPKDSPKFIIDQVAKTFVSWKKELEKVQGKKYCMRLIKKSPQTFYVEIRFKKLKKFQGRSSLRSKVED